MDTPRPGPGSAGDPRDPDGLIDEVDVALLDELARTIATLDPVPDGLVDRARFAVAFEEVEVEVAELLATSAEQGSDLAGVRGTTGEQSLTMTFAAADVTVTLAVTETGRESFRVDGWLTGGKQADVTLRLPDVTRSQRVGVDGRFVFEDVPSGMVQVVVASDGDDDGAVVVTPAFEL